MYLAKGAQNERCAERLAAVLLMVPWQRFTLKSQEPASLSLQHGSIKTCASSNGKGNCDGSLRCLRNTGKRVGRGSCEGSTRSRSILGVSCRGLDGQTAFELRKGKPYRKELPPFAKKVMCLKAGKPRSRLRDRWMKCLFLGTWDGSDEVVIGTRDGSSRREC